MWIDEEIVWPVTRDTSYLRDPERCKKVKIGTMRLKRDKNTKDPYKQWHGRPDDLQDKYGKGAYPENSWDRCTARLSNGQRCKKRRWARLTVCWWHGGRMLETLMFPKDVKLSSARLKTLHKVFGDQFEGVMQAAQDIRDFETDNALFIAREQELAERQTHSDSPEFRIKILNMMVNFAQTWEEVLSFADLNPRLEQLARSQFLEILQFTSEYREHDETWDKLLNNSERRVKMVTSAMNALAKEANTITLKELIEYFGKIVDIVRAECGDERTGSVIVRVEREVFGPVAGMAQRPQLPASISEPGQSGYRP